MTPPRGLSQAALTGQAGLETVFFTAAVIIATVAMVRYMQLSIAGRVKTSADSISPTLFNYKGADVTFLRCQDTVTTKTGQAGVQLVERDGKAVDRTALSGSVPAYQLSDCPP